VAAEQPPAGALLIEVVLGVGVAGVERLSVPVSTKSATISRD
jgi:hypothetical protein